MWIARCGVMLDKLVSLCHGGSDQLRQGRRRAELKTLSEQNGRAAAENEEVGVNGEAGDDAGLFGCLAWPRQLAYSAALSYQDQPSKTKSTDRESLSLEGPDRQCVRVQLRYLRLFPMTVLMWPIFFTGSLRMFNKQGAGGDNESCALTAGGPLRLAGVKIVQTEPEHWDRRMIGCG